MKDPERPKPDPDETTLPLDESAHPTDTPAGCEDGTLSFPAPRADDDEETLPQEGGPSPEPRLPSIPGYEIESELGRGGMGVVYKARQIGLNRVVALKMILAGGAAGREALLRFKAEAEAVAALSHPNIVGLYDFGEFEGLPFFTLEYCVGGSLSDLVREHPLQPKQAAKIVERVARAIEVAHQRDIIHRDLKPANVLLDDHGHPKVTDFGLAKKTAAGEGPTRSGAVMGTPSYMAPEQAKGDAKRVGPATDVWALGAILYRLLTGRAPFQAATDVDTVMQVIKDEPVAVRRLQPKVPRDLETVCLKCLQKQPKKRYASAAELAEDLRRFQNGEPVRARRVGRLGRGWRWCQRNRGPVLVAAVIFLALAAGIVGTSVGLVQANRASREAEAARDELRVTLTRQIAERLQSDFKQLEKAGTTAAAALATGDRWDESEIVSLLKPLLRDDDRVFGIGVAYMPFRVPRTPMAPEPHALAAGTLGMLAAPTGPLPAASVLCSTGYCVYVFKGDGGSIETTYDPSEQSDHRTRDWFNVPLAEERAFWTPIAGFDEQEASEFDTAIVAYVVPLRRDGRVVGVLSVDISIEDFFAQSELSERFDDVNFGARSYAFVVSNSKRLWNGKSNEGKGIFISHPNVEDDRFQYPNGILELNGLDPGFAELAREMVAGEGRGRGVAVDPWKGRESTFVFVPLESEGWTAEMTLVVVIED